MGLQEMSLQLQKVINSKQKEKDENSRAEMAAMVGLYVSEAMTPFVEEIRGLNQTLAQALTQTRKDFTQSVKDIPAPQVRVNVPDVIVPEVKLPVFNIPNIKVPEANVSVTIPEIKLPTINVPEIKIPKITVPKPEVTVNIPKQDFPAFPAFPTEMSVGLENITRDYPLPVMMVDTKGKPLSMGGQSAGKSDFFTIKAIEGYQSFGSGRQTVTSAGTRVQLSSTSVKCREVTVMSETDNTGLIAVGDSSVVAAEGSQRGIILLSGGSSVVLKINDLNMIYIDSSVSGDGVTYAYLA